MAKSRKRQKTRLFVPVEIPEAMHRRLKLRASCEKRKLYELVETLITLGERAEATRTTL